MIDVEVLNRTLELARGAERKLKARFHRDAAEIASLRASGVSEHRIESLYPFSIEDYRAEVYELAAMTTFTYHHNLVVNDLHISDTKFYLPASVQNAVNAELDKADPYDADRSGYFFARGELLMVVVYAHHLAAFDPSEALAQQKPMVHTFNPDFGVNELWQTLLERFTRVDAAVDELIAIRPFAEKHGA